MKRGADVAAVDIPLGSAPRAMACALSAGMWNLRSSSRAVSEAVGESTGRRMKRDSSRPLVSVRSFANSLVVT